jgi:uncharacterized protein with ParB-like and HNH nuclease domain/predicted transport protein
MKATEANLLEFLSIRKQLVIPIYQRTYSWTKSQCQQLWNDILRVAQDKSIPAHFVGSVVYIQEGIYHASSTQQMLVIDGQQRLTTVSLLLLAVAHSIGDSEHSNGISKEEIFDYYLYNNLMKGDMRYKVMLTQSDKDTLIALIDNRELPKSYSQRVNENYEFFREAIRKTTLDISTIFSGIKKLVIVDVSLDRNYDNPQLIFESLNSTGLDLTQADLIRNYVLMGMPPMEQEEIYTRYWYPMEERFGHAEYASLFDRFMRDYLTIKSEIGTIPNIGDVYNEFKKYIQNKNIEDVVADVALFSKYFVRLAFPERSEDIEIRRIMENINTLKVDVAYPLLLEAFDDFERNRLLTREEFIEILSLVESYVFRRAIVGIPTNSMNKTFATFKRSLTKTDYLNSLKYTFLSLDSYRRFPRDDEFWNEFVMKDIYNLRQRRNYLLSKLENYGRKEFVNIEEYTIEHILPQNPNLSFEWKQMLGDEWKDLQSKYLHTIGNLTLTGYNSELSDRPFLEKRDIPGGFADSPLRLNRGLGKLDRWGVKEIGDRAQQLGDLAQQIWELPQLSPEIMQKFQADAEIDTDDYSLDNFEHLQGDILQLFEALKTRILNLDASVREEVKKLYIAYKTTTNFVDIVPQKSKLRLSLNMQFHEINDPKGICKDVTDRGRWGNGDVEVGISSFQELEYALFLIRQSFEKHTDEILT